jgi:hypothetical protein
MSLAVLAIMLNLESETLFGASVDALLTGAVTRARSVTSGHMTHSFVTGLVESTTPPRQLPTKDLWFSGQDWIELIQGTGPADITIHRERFLFRYNETRQPDGSTWREAILSPPDALAVGQENLRPWFAGTFWHPEQLTYVDLHRERFRIVAERTVEGAACVVCEADVPAEDITPHLREPNPLLMAGGRLRLHIAPQLGFAMPQIEIYAPNGRQVVAYTSRSWAELPSQVYFPRQIRKEVRLPDGSTLFEQIEIAPEMVNQQPPESTFVVSVPSGTNVRDERAAGSVRRFRTSMPTTSQQLAEPAIGVAQEGQSAVPSTVIVIALVAFCLISAVALWRWNRRAAMSSKEQRLL